MTVDKRVAAIFIKEIAQGKTLSETCKRSDMPGRNKIYSWLKTDPDFKARYYKARKGAGQIKAILKSKKKHEKSSSERDKQSGSKGSEKDIGKNTKQDKNEKGTKFEDAEVGGSDDPYMNAVLDLIIDRRLTFFEISKMENMPSRSELYRWFDNYPEFKKRLNTIYECMPLELFLEILSITDQYAAGGKRSIDKIKLDYLRVQTENRFKLMEKLAPKLYGQRAGDGLVSPPNGPMISDRTAPLSSYDRRRVINELIFKAKVRRDEDNQKV